MSDSPFRGRTIQVVKDLSIDEQLYLYQEARKLKEQLTLGKKADSFRIKNTDYALYLIFMEESTRTKESFRNAARFHQITVNNFNVQASSFQKKENITDTVKMLVGYNSESTFVIRSRQEGVCRWLEKAMFAYTAKAGLPKPGFINAGDGRHEHPTQEFLDEFSFLEYYKWKKDRIHIAVVGDLFHGRTVHSKAEGLRIFGDVEVDLIAPPELGMPQHYVNAMEANGFRLRSFGSIEEYLAQAHRAPIWYFTRLQIERMGEKLLKQSDYLRNAVTFQRDFLPRIDPATRFFHPLPRHSEHPTIPSFLDSTQFNSWDEQSRNGYFTRIIEIGMLAGKLGHDFEGESPRKDFVPQEFVEQAPIRQKEKPEYKIGIRPVEDGVVIDHIGIGHEPKQIWEHITKIRQVLGLHVVSSQGVFHSEGQAHFKGIISIPSLLDFSEDDLMRLASLAPGSTLNIVRSHRVIRKYRLRLPSRVLGLDGLRCRNESCISHPQYFEPVEPEFYRLPEGSFACAYCNTPHSYKEIWGE